MSGALRKMTNFLGYSEPVDDTYGDAFTEEPRAVVEEDVTESFEDYSHYDQAEEHTVPDLRRIVTVHPTTYNEARLIGESFRDGVPVIVNLTNMSESDARRMVDFSAGLVFGLRGSIERVTPRVFLLTPASVEIETGERGTDSRDRFFNQG